MAERSIMNATSLHFLQLGNKTPLRVAAYTRISTEEERKDRGSFQTQKIFFENLIQSRPGWELAGIYGDYAKTGTQISGRHAFQQMLQDAAQRKMDYIITKSVSRFARNTADCLDSIRKLSACGIGVYFMEQGFDTGHAYGELILTVLASIAEMESESIRTNLLQTHRSMNARGTPVLPARYGYRREGLAWRIVPGEATRIRLAFLLAANSYGLTAIAGRLNELEQEEKTDKHWSATSVRTLLSNEIYAGDILTNKHCKVWNDKGKKTVRNTGFTDQFYIYDHHPAIITREMFQLISSLLKEKMLFGQRNYNAEEIRKVKRKAAGDLLLAEAHHLL